MFTAMICLLSVSNTNKRRRVSWYDAGEGYDGDTASFTAAAPAEEEEDTAAAPAAVTAAAPAVEEGTARSALATLARRIIAGKS